MNDPLNRTGENAMTTDRIEDSNSQNSRAVSTPDPTTHSNSTSDGERGTSERDSMVDGGESKKRNGLDKGDDKKVQSFPHLQGNDTR